MDKTILIDSFNPYESRFPKRKLVTKGTLELIKVLRQNGYKVIVKPDDGKPYQYLYKKGLHDLFSDPLFTFLIGLPVSFILNLLSNSVQKYIDRSNQLEKKEEIFKNIIVTDNSTNITIDLNGKIIHKGEQLDLIKKRKKISSDFEKCFSIISPYPHLPTPIFLEHKPKLVGWCKLEYSDTSLVFSESKILDKSVFRKIKKGKIRGGSLTGIAEQSTCSICKSNYVDCNHIAGEYYDNEPCINIISNATIIEVSFVKTPINPECLVNLK